MDESVREFSKRLQHAVQNMKGIVPGYREGRNTVISRKVGVAPETVRKWLAGEAMPRARTMAALAKYLDVDAGWLWGGSEKTSSTKDKRLYKTQTEGVAHLALGMAMIEGASCAPPDMHDPRKEFVDFIMIKGGVQAAIHTSLGREVSPDSYEFTIPAAFDQVRNVGFVWHNPTKVHLLDLSSNLIEAHKVARGSDKAIVAVYKNGKYLSGRDEWPRINSIGEIL